MGTNICFLYEVQLLSEDPHGYSPAGIVRALQSVGVSDMQQVSAVSQEDDLISGKAECFFRVRTREIVDKLVALPPFKAVSVSGTEYDMSFCEPKACMADRERLRYNLVELKRLETDMTAMGARQHLFSGMPFFFSRVSSPPFPDSGSAGELRYMLQDDLVEADDAYLAGLDKMKKAVYNGRVADLRYLMPKPVGKAILEERLELLNKERVLVLIELRRLQHERAIEFDIPGIDDV